ncbi:unnamed protein product [Penicillium olsonii]|nr:unnamed protein product [Penicillium olsonii]
MRWFSTLLALAATGALQVNALDATILTFPPGSKGPLHSAPKQQELSQEEARLVLELRMQSSVASVLGVVDADTVGHLNHFADIDSALFGGSSNQPIGKSLLILEGVEQRTASELQRSQPAHIVVSQVSSKFIDTDFLKSCLEVENHGHYCAWNNGDGVTSMKAQTLPECLSQDPMLAGHLGSFDRGSLTVIDSVQDWTSVDSQISILKLSFKSQDSSSSVADSRLLRSLINHLTKLLASSQREVTAVILPPGSTSVTLSRRGEKSIRSSVGSQNIAQQSTQDSSLPSTLAPVCHSSNSSCAEATRNCSGHGSCYLKFGTGAEGTTGNCYACKCQQSIVKNSDGTTKTIQWGGSACQKKDISSPFFLVAGVSLLAILLVGSAISMLFSMGSQKLPSTISAGVSNPRSQM